MADQGTGTEILGEQVRQLYRLSRPAYVATLLTGGIVTLLLWDRVGNAWLLAWFAVLAVVMVARYALYRAYSREVRPAADAPLWARRFVIGAGVTGVLWGIAGSALYPAASLPHQLLLIFLIGGMVISALVILAPVRQAFLAYMLPAMVLVTATVFAQGTPLHLFIGVLLVVFTGVMLGTGPVLSDMMRESLRVKFENAALVERLSQANRELSDRISAQQQTEQALQFFASHDPLTGLFNRSMFHERLQQALAQAQRFERSAALLFIDLDGFKLINDTLGHNAGDALLVEIAGRLRTSLREGDVVARMGGDEFVVLIEEFAEAGQVAEVAKKVLETVAKPYVLHNQEYSVTTSIGVATYPKDGTDAQALLKNADIAMYRAKEGGKNNFRFSSPEMNVHLIERLTLESGLRRALERDEMRLLYQPKVSIRTGGITGIEALVRWNHPTQGTIGPPEFVPIAEDTGLINAIGEWVLRTACAQARSWREQGLPWLRIAVNLSARQFGQDNLIEVVREVLHEVRLDPERLELEITEGMVIRNPERAVKVLAQLRELGVRVTLDDFGTGYSSLGYLMRCPVDAVKLDRSFVLKLPGDADSATIAHAVIGMAHSLKLQVIAEGVETREQWEFLHGLDCDEMQGNYFSEPVAADIVPGLLRLPAVPGKRSSVQTLHPRRSEAGGEKPES